MFYTCKTMGITDLISLGSKARSKGKSNLDGRKMSCEMSKL